MGICPNVVEYILRTFNPPTFIPPFEPPEFRIQAEARSKVLGKGEGGHPSLEARNPPGFPKGLGIRDPSESFFWGSQIVYPREELDRRLWVGLRFSTGSPAVTVGEYLYYGYICPLIGPLNPKP